MKWRRNPGAWRDERGSALVEMAIALPVFVTLMLALVQVSITLYNFCNAVQGVRAGSRYASLHSATSPNPTTQAKIKSIVTANLLLTGTSAPAVLLCYGTNTGGGTQCSTTQGNNIGDLVGVGIVWANPGLLPGMSTFYLSSTSYRIITR
jgi:Flp pilus assembly protein TadG